MRRFVITIAITALMLMVVAYGNIAPTPAVIKDADARFHQNCISPDVDYYLRAVCKVHMMAIP